MGYPLIRSKSTIDNLNIKKSNNIITRIDKRKLPFQIVLSCLLDLQRLLLKKCMKTAVCKKEKYSILMFYTQENDVIIKSRLIFVLPDISMFPSLVNFINLTLFSATFFSAIKFLTYDACTMTFEATETFFF